MSVLVMVGCAMLAGCAEPVGPGQPISGQVNVEGKPLRHGTLTLKPLDRDSGPKITIGIRNGQYQLPAERGPWPGEFQVMISATPPELIAMLEGASHEQIIEKAKERDKSIAREFNSASRLRLTIKKGEPNTRDFNIRWTN